MPDDDSNKKFKGRAVLDGSWVKDENYDVALFNEMGSSPANMQAGKADFKAIAAEYVEQMSSFVSAV